MFRGRAWKAFVFLLAQSGTYVVSLGMAKALFATVWTRTSPSDGHLYYIVEVVIISLTVAVTYVLADERATVQV